MPSKIILDVSLLKKYYCEDNLKIREIGELFNCSPAVVSKAIKEHNLLRNYKNPEWIRQKHYIEKKTIGEICEEANCSREPMRLTMRKYNMDALDEVKYRNVTKYACNSTFFDNIDTERKAYWLGFITADGSIIHEKCNSYRLSIQLAIKDEGHLQKFLNDIGSDAKIEYGSTFLEKTKKAYGFCKVRINNSYMCNSLMKQGVLPKKSGKEVFPNIDPSLVQHFIRGVFDGDGSLCHYFCSKANKMTTSFCIVGGSELLTKIGDVLFLETGIDLATRIEDSVICRIGSGGKGIMKIMDWLYTGSTVYLDRKYEIYQSALPIN